jgi:hypothetical protein
MKVPLQVVSERQNRGDSPVRAQRLALSTTPADEGAAGRSWRRRSPARGKSASRPKGPVAGPPDIAAPGGGGQPCGAACALGVEPTNPRWTRMAGRWRRPRTRFSRELAAPARGTLSTKSAGVMRGTAFRRPRHVTGVHGTRDLRPAGTTQRSGSLGRGSAPSRSPLAADPADSRHLAPNGVASPPPAKFRTMPSGLRALYGRQSTGRHGAVVGEDFGDQRRLAAGGAARFTTAAALVASTSGARLDAGVRAVPQ